MYSRSYYPDADRMNLPENYDGTAFMDRANTDVEEQHVTPEGEDNATPVFKNNDVKEPVAKQVNGLGNLPFLSGLFGDGGILGNLGLHIPTIGTEEILILATAAFLFFSKSGDRECALILLLLLFIN